MKVLLCAATEMEIAATVQQSNLYKNRPDVILTGVGLLAATYSLTKAVESRRPDLIIQAGVAGTFDKTHTLGSVVAVQSEIVGDLGVQEGGSFHSLFDLKLVKEDDHPWTKGKLMNKSNVLSTCGLALATGITVNEITTNPKKNNTLPNGF